MENFALLALTIVSSSENFGIHKTGFGTFVTCSGFYMIVTVYLVTKCGYQARNLYERKSLVWKKRLLKTSAVAGT